MCFTASFRSSDRCSERRGRPFALTNTVIQNPHRDLSDPHAVADMFDLCSALHVSLLQAFQQAAKGTWSPPIETEGFDFARHL